MSWCWWVFAAGVVAGWVLKSAVVVMGDYLDRRPVDEPAVELEASPPAPPAPEPAPVGRAGAKDVLGYRDLGGRWVPPTHPVTVGCGSSAAALAVWGWGR